MNCTHHFIIPPPNGSTSIGICKLCGLEREMINYIESVAWPKRREKSLASQRQVALKASEKRNHY